MAEPFDPDKMQKELMEQLKKMMEQQDPPLKPEEEKEREKTDEDGKDSKRQKVLEFNLKPKDVKKHLDRFVIKQDEAKKVLATAVCDHYNHVKLLAQGETDRNYMKQNIIILGPTGVGKTYLIKHLADLIGVPFIKADATKFSETGYVGGDVEDLVRDLVQKAEGDMELAQYGMIYLDEVDKIATPTSTTGRDVSGSGVQRGLLKIMEDTDVPLRSSMDIQSQIQGMMEFQKKGKVTKPTINTKNILFIVSGAFSELTPIIQKRLKQSQIGFKIDTDHSDIKEKEIFNQAETKDFIDFGFEPEFIGRLPVRVICDSLTEEDLYTILNSSEESILKQYISAFKAYNIKMKVKDEALWEIAKVAAKEKTGARGLFTVFEKTFRHLKYELPSTHIKEFQFTPQMVLTPSEETKELLKEERKQKLKEIEKEVCQFEEAFEEKNSIQIQFDSKALKCLQEKIIEQDEDTLSYLEKLLSNYAYGLSLIQQKKGTKKFTITKDIINKPNVVLDQWIKETFKSDKK